MSKAKMMRKTKSRICKKPVIYESFLIFKKTDGTTNIRNHVKTNESTSYNYSSFIIDLINYTH